ncbi:MAG: LytTR family DNA-binding domain-containing protein [Turicibacter sp.]|nr:LytTR family DNA-binding domain-containing protein [Turicibacter sp.]
MLSVIICEDDIKQRERLETTIRNYLMMENYPTKIVLSTHNPDDVMNYLKSNPKTVGLYFFDVDLQHELNGITLASKVREWDDLGKIVFITTHGELSYLTFTYKVEAMDYIIKDQPNLEQRVRECIALAHSRHLKDTTGKKQQYKIKVGDVNFSIPYDDIMFFESAPVPHKIILHRENSQLEFYGSIKGIADSLPDFFRCHKSYVINPKNIRLIEESTREAEMVNGQRCLVSVRKLKELKGRL